MSGNKKLSEEDKVDLLASLKKRFEANMNRHEGIKWCEVEKRLGADAGKLWSLSEMERTGGVADVVGRDKKTGEFIFFDCGGEPEGAAERLL